MNMNKANCILSKIINMGIIISAIALTPSQIYLGVAIDVFNIVSLIILSFIVGAIGVMGLLQTNDPLTRYNPFSFNKKWRNKMNQSVSENPLQIFKLDEPSKDEVRNRKIDKILD